MLRSKRSEILAASLLMAPFVVTYGVLFVYPTIKMAQLSLTNAPLIGPGKWVGFDNYFRLASDRLFSVAIWNTLYFVALSVIPSTLLGLLVALGVNRLKGWLQSVVLAAFFLPYVLPVSVVFRIWQWMCDKDFGIAQHVVQLFNNGERLSIFRTIPLFMPAVAIVTIWCSSVSTFFCSSLACAHFRRDLRGGGTRRSKSLDAIQAHHLAADLACDCARVHNPADPAAQDF
jgi:multiple sugar transport system permease protein